jgi:hypothetical protein
MARQLHAWQDFQCRQYKANLDLFTIDSSSSLNHSLIPVADEYEGQESGGDHVLQSGSESGV